MVICVVGHNGMTADCKSAASGTVGSIPSPRTKFQLGYSVMVSTTVFEAVRLGSSPSTSAKSFTEGYATGDVASVLKAERARNSQGFDSAIPPPVLWKFI